MPHADAEEESRTDLHERVSHVLQECRIILPGIQALFGFQLVAAFSPVFGEQPLGHRVVHLLALASVAVAVALAMSPAAYHRQMEPDRVSGRFVRIATRLLVSSLVCLGLATALDFFVVASATVHSDLVGVLLGGSVLVVYIGLWFVLPPIWRGK